jgi:hypothetical protein
VPDYNVQIASIINSEEIHIPKIKDVKLKIVSINEDKHQEGLLKTSHEVDTINTDNDKEEAKKKISDSLNLNSNTSNNIDNNDITIQLKNLQEQIIDIKAQISGLTKIMKDILEENRNILNKL